MSNTSKLQLKVNVEVVICRLFGWERLCYTANDYELFAVSCRFDHRRNWLRGRMVERKSGNVG